MSLPVAGRGYLDLNLFSLCVQCFSDIPHTLRNYLSEQGWIDVVITDAKKEPDVYKKIKEYEFGVAQPAVLCIKPDKTVLYSWAISPSKVREIGCTRGHSPSVRECVQYS